jgi:hypothetical protein
VLAGDAYYPTGWGDFRGSFDSVDEAVVAAKQAAIGLVKSEHVRETWWQVIDKETDKLVERSW